MRVVRYPIMTLQVKKFCPVFLLIISIFITQTAFGLVKIGLDRYFIPEGNFSVLLFEPKKVVTPTENRIGRVTAYSYQSYFPAFDVFYSAQYTDWSEYKKKLRFSTNTDEMFKTSIDGLMYTWQYRLNTKVSIGYKKEINYKAYPGKEIEYFFDSTGERYKAMVRIYIIENQEYMLICIFPEKYVGITQYQRFLNSFEVK